MYHEELVSVTPSKIKIQTSQYRKSRILEMKEDKYTKRLAKNQVCANIHMRDIWKNVLPKFIRICMETPCWCPFEGHKYCYIAILLNVHVYMKLENNASE